MRERPAIGVSTVLIAMLLVGAQALPVSAAKLSFGARLDKSSQPSNAEGGQRCADNSGIPTGATCSWVATEAYRRPDPQQNARAPKDGTIGTVKLVSCIQGSFKLQFARVKPAQDKAKVVRNGPTIAYAADPRHTDGDQDTFCGGESGDDYIVQSFPVSVAVKAGDYIAIKAKKTGTLYCSGGGGVSLFAPPLAPGGSFRTANGDTSCQMLVQLVYR